MKRIQLLSVVTLMMFVLVGCAGGRCGGLFSHGSTSCNEYTTTMPAVPFHDPSATVVMPPQAAPPGTVLPGPGVQPGLQP